MCVYWKNGVWTPRATYVLCNWLEHRSSLKMSHEALLDSSDSISPGFLNSLANSGAVHRQLPRIWADAVTGNASRTTGAISWTANLSCSWEVKLAEVEEEGVNRTASLARPSFRGLVAFGIHLDWCSCAWMCPRKELGDFSSFLDWVIHTTGLIE